MIYLALPGVPIPNWLERVEVAPGGKLGSFKFGNVSAVWLFRGTFYVLPLLPILPVMTIKNSANVKIIGQKNGVICFRGVLAALLFAVKGK